VSAVEIAILVFTVLLVLFVGVQLFWAILPIVVVAVRSMSSSSICSACRCCFRYSSPVLASLLPGLKDLRTARRWLPMGGGPLALSYAPGCLREVVKDGHLWWLLLLVVPIALLILGRRHLTEAAATLVQPIALKMVEPPTLVRLQEMAAKN
jgi:hypothetical protein